MEAQAKAQAFHEDLAQLLEMCKEGHPERRAVRVGEFLSLCNSSKGTTCLWQNPMAAPSVSQMMMANHISKDGGL